MSLKAVYILYNSYILHWNISISSTSSVKKVTNNNNYVNFSCVKICAAVETALTVVYVIS